MSVRRSLVVGLALFAGADAFAASVPDLSARKIAIAENGISRSRGAFVTALHDSLSSSFGAVIRTRSSKKRSKPAALRRAARTLGADYVIALSEKKSVEPHRISIRLLGVESTLLTTWTVPALADEEQLMRSGQAIGQRALVFLADEPSGASDALAGDNFASGDVPPVSADLSRDDLSSDDATREVLTSSGLSSAEPARDAPPPDEFSLAREELREAGDLTKIEADPTAGPLYSAGGITLTAQAKLKTETLLYFTNNTKLVGDGKVNRRLSADLTAGLKLKTQYVDAEAGVLVRRDLSDAARNRLEPAELTLALQLDPLRVFAGHTTITWGRATLNSVVDVIDPVDARDFLIREKLPVWIAGAGLTVGPLHADVLFLPFFRADIVDIPGGVAETGGIQSPNRWINGSFPVVTQNFVPVEYSFDPGLPATELVFAPQTGARISTSLFDVDLALSYVNQVDPFPSVRSNVRSSAEKIEVSSEVQYHRRHVFALDGEATAGRFHFIGEAMLALPRTKALENNGGTLPYIATTIGVDFRAPRIYEDHELRIFVEATATRALVGELPNDPADPSVAITRGRFPFPLALMAHAGYSFGENVSIGVLAVTNLGQLVFKNTGLAPELDLYLRPEVKIALFHRVQAVAGVDLLLGGQDQFFGAFKQNSRFSTSIQVDYDY